MSDNLHDVVVEFSGGLPLLTFRCRADAATDPECHMVCPEPDCEEGCGDPSHVKANVGECRIVTWLDNSDADECIYGGTTSVTVPIAHSWHSEGVDWAFAEPTP